MGKSKQRITYDKKALSKVAIQLQHTRRPMENQPIPKVQVNLDELEKVILALPRKKREVLERFWGLIPGTIDHSKSYQSKSKNANDVAYNNMAKEVLKVTKELIGIEYLYLYDDEVKKLVSLILTKVDKSGVEEVSDIDTIKYLIIFFVFLLGGPRIIFEEENAEINLEYEEKAHFDEYALLKVVWEDSMSLIPENSVNLKLLLEALDMFDLRDVIAMKRFAKLQVEKEYEEIETDPMNSFKSVRLFKERIFRYGPWDITALLIYQSKDHGINFEKFAENFSLFRENWQNIETFKKGRVVIKTSRGKKKIKFYEIEGLQFTDIYEVMFLYSSRNVS